MAADRRPLGTGGVMRAAAASACVATHRGPLAAEDELDRRLRRLARAGLADMQKAPEYISPNMTGGRLQQPGRSQAASDAASLPSDRALAASPPPHLQSQRHE
ncbi:hypothetical protein TSOC_010499 [Tetrabaena socialis]|uniref:Uncharacterized protein n=1 Tax=Tetrabaena socialis TaxID=47790 RepID=A0A2J7ZT47_9CHLO|nr:hypothetical protein TSOC_010499 [Tetrabaena socialis]|eukprot:PNH03446.1 hypothetical protein TSOC_010499 [Tetrabaena socialis]